MSAMFDYITGKKSGREAELEASLEHLGGYLGVEMDDNEKLRAEVGRLRTALRVNALRWGYTDAEIDAILRPADEQ